MADGSLLVNAAKSLDRSSSGAASGSPAAGTHGGPLTRRWTEQRWLLDNTIRAVGMDWDQPRSIYLSVPCGPEANADFAAIRQRITKLADASPTFEAVARRHLQVLKDPRPAQVEELASGGPLDRAKPRDELVMEQGLGVRILEGPDHRSSLVRVTSCVKTAAAGVLATRSGWVRASQQRAEANGRLPRPRYRAPGVALAWRSLWIGPRSPTDGRPAAAG